VEGISLLQNMQNRLELSSSFQLSVVCLSGSLHLPGNVVGA